MYSYEITKPVAETHRQALLAEARAHRTAKAVRRPRQARRGWTQLSFRRTSRLAIAR